MEQYIQQQPTITVDPNFQQTNTVQQVNDPYFQPNNLQQNNLQQNYNLQQNCNLQQINTPSFVPQSDQCLQQVDPACMTVNPPTLNPNSGLSNEMSARAEYDSLSLGQKIKRSFVGNPEVYQTHEQRRDRALWGPKPVPAEEIYHSRFGQAMYRAEKMQHPGQQTWREHQYAKSHPEYQ
eukprot:Phypoly_transcript_15788.p1 GENE.Phypoly_transcript_15788~~Phypoly_transcript_15788.p1  ORF type:complete len:179 (+),score=39.18 Phypoly_transcript_15788:301-837(+)